MKAMRWLRSWASPLTAGTFGAVGLTGVLMFLHVGGGVIKGVHEWVGLVLVAAACAHLAVNWRPFLRYFRNPAALGLMLVPLLLGAGALVTSGAGEAGHGPPPSGGLMDTLAGLPLRDVIRLTGETPESLVGTLRGVGLTARGDESTVTAIAEANGVRRERVLAALFDDRDARASHAP